MIAAVTLAAVLAWPVDVVVDLEVGSEKFHRLSGAEWMEVEDPAVAGAELLESGELLLTGKAPGRTLLLLYGQGRVAAWRLRVGGAKAKIGGDAELAAVKKTCPGVATTDGLAATVKDEPCRRALLTLFQTDAYLARELELTFELAALQSQLTALKPPKGVTARYIGAGLELKGEATREEHRKLLWNVFKSSAGRVALDDRIEIRP